MAMLVIGFIIGALVMAVMILTILIFMLREHYSSNP